MKTLHLTSAQSEIVYNALTHRYDELVQQFENCSSKELQAPILAELDEVWRLLDFYDFNSSRFADASNRSRLTLTARV